MVNREDIKLGDIIEWQNYNRITYGHVVANQEGDPVILLQNGKTLPLDGVIHSPSAKLVRQ